jgi:hypothetical protein
MLKFATNVVGLERKMKNYVLFCYFFSALSPFLSSYLSYGGEIVLFSPVVSFLIEGGVLKWVILHTSAESPRGRSGACVYVVSITLA